MGDGERVVPRNHLECDPLLAEVTHGFLHVGTQRVTKAQKRQRDQALRQGFTGQGGGGARQRQHAQPLRGQRLRLRERLTAQQAFRRTQHHAAQPLGLRRGPFALAGKRHRLQDCRSVLGGKRLGQRAHGGRFVGAGMEQQRHACADFLRRRIPQRKGSIKEHLATGKRAGFIHAYHVGAGQRFDAEKLIDQRVAAAQRHHARRQGNRREQNQSFGNHAQHRGDRAGDGVRKAEVHGGVLSGKHGGAYGKNDGRHPADDAAHVPHQLALGAFDASRGKL